MDFMYWNSSVFGLSPQMDCNSWIAWIEGWELMVIGTPVIRFSPHPWIATPVLPGLYGFHGAELICLHIISQLDCKLWIASFAWMAWIVWMGNPVRISSLQLDCNYFQLNKSLVVF